MSTVDYGMYAVGLLHSIICDRNQILFQWVTLPCSNSIAELLLSVSLTHTHIMVHEYQMCLCSACAPHPNGSSVMLCSNTMMQSKYATK